MLITKHILFIGFSFTDYNFHKIISAVRRAVRGDPSTPGEPHTGGATPSSSMPASPTARDKEREAKRHGNFHKDKGQDEQRKGGKQEETEKTEGENKEDKQSGASTPRTPKNKGGKGKQHSKDPHNKKKNHGWVDAEKREYPFPSSIVDQQQSEDNGTNDSLAFATALMLVQDALTGRILPEHVACACLLC